jgi:hypothetical protein
VTKAKAWREWWQEKHGKNMPMGGYHPMEGNMYDAFTAGWEARTTKLPAVSDQTGHVQSTDNEGRRVSLEV